MTGQDGRNSPNNARVAELLRRIGVYPTGELVGLGLNNLDKAQLVCMLVALSLSIFVLLMLVILVPIALAQGRTEFGGEVLSHLLP